MFVDEVKLTLSAGDGGDGCLAYRREKYVEMGGPDGGNGGRGANIVFKVDEGLNTLLDLRSLKIIKGLKGGNGLGKGMHGKAAEDIYLKVPAGTIISNVKTGQIICDLTKANEEFIVAKGGRGGRGNISLRTRNIKCPNYAENGEPGEELEVKIELKLLADVGLVGLPSVGKSTIISKISAAKPKIASYHFTTLHPNLGMVRVTKDKSFVVADLPGLIEGASLGAGLGDRFLKHIERTRVIAHVIDMSGSEGRNPIEDYYLIKKELENFNKNIILKPEIIIANKMDMPNFKENLEKFQKEIKLPIYPISALEEKGLDKVIFALSDILDNISKEKYEEEVISHVLYEFKDEDEIKITHPKSNMWVIEGAKVEKLLKMTYFKTDDAFLRFAKELKNLGVDDLLEKQGAKDGDIIKILETEFEYKKD